MLLFNSPLLDLALLVLSDLQGVAPVLPLLVINRLLQLLDFLNQILFVNVLFSDALGRLRLQSHGIYGEPALLPFDAQVLPLRC